MQLIDKLAYIYIREQKILSTLSKQKDTWYIPGGKRENGETDIQALTREVKEELSVDLKQETIKPYGTFEAQAHGHDKGVVVRMTCYTAEFDGELKAASEIAQFDFLKWEDKDKSSPVDKLIFDDLHQKGLIE